MISREILGAIERLQDRAVEENDYRVSTVLDVIKLGLEEPDMTYLLKNLKWLEDILYNDNW